MTVLCERELPGHGIACITAQAARAEEEAFWNIGNRYGSRKSRTRIHNQPPDASLAEQKVELTAGQSRQSLEGGIANGSLFSRHHSAR